MYSEATLHHIATGINTKVGDPSFSDGEHAARNHGAVQYHLARVISCHRNSPISNSSIGSHTCIHKNVRGAVGNLRIFGIYGKQGQQIGSLKKCFKHQKWNAIRPPKKYSVSGPRPVSKLVQWCSFLEWGNFKVIHVYTGTRLNFPYTKYGDYKKRPHKSGKRFWQQL